MRGFWMTRNKPSNKFKRAEEMKREHVQRSEMLVYSKRIALELERRGFKILRTEPNTKFPRYNVFWFESTPEMITEFNNIRRETEKEFAENEREERLHNCDEGVDSVSKGKRFRQLCRDFIIG